MSYADNARIFEANAAKLWQVLDAWCLVPHAYYYSIIHRVKAAFEVVGLSIHPTRAADEMIATRQGELVRQWRLSGKEGAAPSSHDAMLSLLLDELARRGASLNDLRSASVEWRELKKLRIKADYKPQLFTEQDAVKSYEAWAILDSKLYRAGL